jgi:hypothetical protein
MNFSNENIYWHGRGGISSFLSRLLHGHAPTTFLTSFFSTEVCQHFTNGTVEVGVGRLALLYIPEHLVTFISHF